MENKNLWKKLHAFYMKYLLICIEGEKAELKLDKMLLELFPENTELSKNIKKLESLLGSELEKETIEKHASC